MALKKTVSTAFGFDVVDAYHRVTQLVIEPKNKMRFVVKSYKDVAHHHFDEQRHVCDYDPAGANAHAQAYAYLKTLDEFTNAEDC